MKKSEVVREAGRASQEYKDNERESYCTPSRAMVRSVRQACQRHDMPEVVDEMCDRVAAQMRTLSGREVHEEDLEEFDTMDTSAAYAIWDTGDRIVRASFEGAAISYEREEALAEWLEAETAWTEAVAAWLAAETEWEEARRVAAPPVMTQKTAPPLDPAQRRAKSRAKAATVQVKA